MAKSPLPRLDHVLKAIAQIKIITEGKQLSDIETDRISRSAMEREFEIISEASRHLPEDLKDRHPDIPWGKIAHGGKLRASEMS